MKNKLFVAGRIEKINKATIKVTVVAQDVSGKIYKFAAVIPRSELLKACRS